MVISHFGEINSYMVIPVLTTDFTISDTNPDGTTAF